MLSGFGSQDKNIVPESSSEASRLDTGKGSDKNKIFSNQFELSQVSVIIVFSNI